MSEYIPLIQASDVPNGKSVRVQVDGHCYAVCNADGRFAVTDCVCPHAGGPLGDADVRDNAVICPVHYWPWNLDTGLTDDNMPDMRLKVYPCEVRDGTVYAAVSGNTPGADDAIDCRT